jgi:hypothetical protein
MYQKGKIWRFIALFFVLSIGISLFAMSPMLALASLRLPPDIVSRNGGVRHPTPDIVFRNGGVRPPTPDIVSRNGGVRPPTPLVIVSSTSVDSLRISIPRSNTVLFGVWRPDGSTVGSVHIELGSGQINQCVNLDQQNIVYGFGGVNGEDTITIEHYAGANCQGAEGVNRESSKTYRGSINSLAPGSPDGKYRIYPTPKDA